MPGSGCAERQLCHTTVLNAKVICQVGTTESLMLAVSLTVLRLPVSCMSIGIEWGPQIGAQKGL